MGCNTSKTVRRAIIKSTSSSHFTPLASPTKGAIRPSTFVFHKTSDLSKDYEMGPVLGAGAFGCVRIAVHKPSNNERAIKTMKKERILKDSISKLQFFSEIEILKEIDHPNVLKIFEYYEDSKCYHIVTELLKGGELFEYLSSSEHLSETIAAHFMKQLLQAVNYCHSKGIVHRDLKPENLLLETKSAEGTLKIIDFGASTVYTGETPMKARLGTCYYIAPEVLKRNYSEKCDIWSCGVILYIMLSGHPPFTGKDDAEILKKVEKGYFSLNSSEWSHISEEGKNLVSQMMEYEPETRISAENALNHPWLQINNKEKSKPIPAVISNLRRFRATQKLQHAVLTFISSHLVSKKEIKQLAETFKTIDTNGDGKLSKDELFEEFSKNMKEEDALKEVERIFQTVDNDCNGFVDYSEFLVATLKKETVVSVKNLEYAFSLFDTDGNGTITAEEIKEILGDEMEDQVWEDVIRKVDQNGDGCIDLKEFKDMMVEIIER
jgi:calcium-dependent protein kinase